MKFIDIKYKQMLEAVCCFHCRYPLGSIYQAFLILRKHFLGDVKPTESQNLVPVFEVLKIEKYCCRQQLATSLTMDDLIDLLD